MRIGPYEVTSVETGRFGLDGGAMFGIVPKPIWEKRHPADSANRIELSLRCLLARKPADASGPARNILVDCGIGEKWADKHISMYGIDHSKWTLDGDLARHGLTREQITDVVLTHLHFDHAGGLTRRADPKNPTSELVATFPNARVFLQKRNWDLAWSPSEKDRASYLTENYALYKDASAWGRKLELVDTAATDPSGRTAFGKPDSRADVILPGISVEVSHGHTLGMQLVRIADPADASKSVVYCADLIPTSSHVRVPYIMGYDCYPIFILQEKKRLLSRVADEGSYVFYEHCPHMAASRVRRTDKGDFEAVDPLVTL